MSLGTGAAGCIGSYFVLDWLAHTDEPIFNLAALLGERELRANGKSFREQLAGVNDCSYPPGASRVGREPGWELLRSLVPQGSLVARDAASGSSCRDFGNREGIAQIVRHAAPEVVANSAAFVAADTAENRRKSIRGIATGAFSLPAARPSCSRLGPRELPHAFLIQAEPAPLAKRCRPHAD